MRIEVLNIFRRLHRVSRRVFKGDERALSAISHKIKNEFMKNKDITNSDEILKLVNEGREVEKFLSERVVQAVQTQPHTYKIHIRKETQLENSPPLPNKQ